MAGVTVVAKYDEQSAVLFLVVKALAIRDLVLLIASDNNPHMLRGLTNNSLETVIVSAYLHRRCNCRCKLGATEHSHSWDTHGEN